MIVLLGLAVYCFLISNAAQKVVSAVDGPPLLQENIDFSKPFTNEFTFHQTVQPFYGTIYLTLRAQPWPKEWTTAGAATEDMQAAQGDLRVYQTNNVLIDERRLDWFYDRIPHSNPETAPLQRFFGRLPPGYYRFAISTAAGVAKLEGVKQQLVLRYDMIHERPIASFFRTLGVILGFAGLITGVTLTLLIKRATGQHRLL
jgi:hypothetical protein